MELRRNSKAVSRILLELDLTLRYQSVAVVNRSEAIKSGLRLICSIGIINQQSPTIRRHFRLPKCRCVDFALAQGESRCSWCAED